MRAIVHVRVLIRACARVCVCVCVCVCTCVRAHDEKSACVGLCKLSWLYKMGRHSCVNRQMFCFVVVVFKC